MTDAPTDQPTPYKLDEDVSKTPPDIIDVTGVVWTQKFPKPDRVSLSLTREHLLALARFEKDRGQLGGAALFEGCASYLEEWRQNPLNDPTSVTIHEANGLDGLGRRWVLIRPEPGKVAWPLTGIEYEYMVNGYNEAAQQQQDLDNDDEARCCAERAKELRIVALEADPNLAFSEASKAFPLVKGHA